MTANKILINRAPVLTLWAAVVGRAAGIQARGGVITRKGRGKVDGAEQGPAIGHIQTDSKGTQEGP